MNIQEDYVSFEVAKLLKEKGFNPLECGMYYSITTGKRTTELLTSLIACPTLQMVMKWLREEYKFLITIDLGIGVYVWTITNIDECTVVQIDAIVGSYEQTCEAAIKYCIENLI